jgi:electron-transferring-flavoprotein dehydrogenase
MQRDALPVDVLFVGAGPANLSAAIHLARTLQAKGIQKEIVIIEKSQRVGGHILSGAVMDPIALAELFPDWRSRGCPIEAEVTHEEVYILFEKKAMKLPIVPPPLKNQGLVIATLSDVVVWLKEELEKLGIMVFEGFAGSELLMDGDRVRGVRLMDRGVNPDGTAGATFAPGADITAQVTIFGEGSRGSLTKQLVEKLKLQGPNPQIYGTGCKEVWRLPAGRFSAGKVIHSAGWPASSSLYAGSWIYGMKEHRVSIGYVTALDARHPWNDPWEMFQRWKTHPMVRELLAGGELLKSGAKTVPEGGYWSRPKSAGAGFLIVGDSGSLLNISRLKGIHTAMKSGLLAAETLVDAIAADDFSESRLMQYEERFQASWLHTELYRVRNYRQRFKSGFYLGGLISGIEYLLGGFGNKPVLIEADYQEMLPQAQASSRPPAPAYDGQYLIDKLTQVYHAGAIHNQHQPSHLKVTDPSVCATRCREEYGNPCERFCPASVYEMVDDGRSGKTLQINFSNCVHCKTCDILDPYQIIQWTVPSDAGGPKYQGL